MTWDERKGSTGTLLDDAARDGRVALHCGRCRGLLYWTELREWDGSRGQDGHGALQCVLCGNIIDPVIVKNRQRCSERIGGGAARRHDWRQPVSAYRAVGKTGER